MVKRLLIALLLLMILPFISRQELVRQPQTAEASVQEQVLQQLPPMYATTSASPKSKHPTSAGKTVFLTFDDGPSALTGKVLDILKKNNIRATFFVLGEQVKRYPELLRRIHEEGHAIGNHSYDHHYTELYSGFPAFWNQIKRTEEEVYAVTGVRPQLVRAPGGTAGHFDDTYFRLMKLGGYVVTDWNVDSGDSKRRGVPAAEIVKGAKAPANSDRVVLLLHDGSGHEESVKALPEIIAHYKKQGYRFDVLSPDEEPVQFKVNEKAKKLKRAAPSESWVQSHVAGNGALFASGKPLRLEVGPMETTLNPGEYLYKDGHYLVPVRAVAERLGGNAVWDPKTQTAKVTLSADSDTVLNIQVRTGRLTVTKAGKNVSSVTTSVTMINDAVWIPLRDLFANAGYADAAASENREERRVKVS